MTFLRVNSIARAAWGRRARCAGFGEYAAPLNRFAVAPADYTFARADDLPEFRRVDHSEP